MKNAKIWLFWIAITAIGFGCFYLIIILGFWFTSGDKIYPGVSVAGISLAGKTKAEAEGILKEKADEITKKDITLTDVKPEIFKASDINLNYDAA